ncbi:phosphomannomutase [Rhizobium sp. A37_96]
MSSLKFGTSGLRGLSADLVGRASALYATAFAHYLLKSGHANPGDLVLVGRDFRESSPAISATCIGALRRAGLTPIDCGTLPTPALALYGLQLKAASLMITGSHIPADRNGIKFYRPDGEIDKRDEVAIGEEALAIGDSVLDETPAEAENRTAQTEALFLDRNKSLLPSGSLAGLTIGVYQHSTVARDLFGQVLAHYGARVVPLGRSESFIPVDTEAVSSDTIRLMKGWAPEHGLDAIVSADGDGDRPLVADEAGEPLRGDLLGLIAANFLGADVVVTPVTSNSGIEAAGPYAVTRTRVGSPYVIAGMDEAVAAGKANVMGFEANGGTLTASRFSVEGKPFDPLPTRDSFLPILATLHAAAKAGKPLSAVAGSYRLPFAAADRLENFPVETSAALMAYLRASDANLADFLKPVAAVASTSDIDGLRVALVDNRIIHFRPSGNAPEMRCYVESSSESEAKALLEQGLGLIQAWAAARL